MKTEDRNLTTMPKHKREMRRLIRLQGHLFRRVFTKATNAVRTSEDEKMCVQLPMEHSEEK